MLSLLIHLSAATSCFSDFLFSEPTKVIPVTHIMGICAFLFFFELVCVVKTGERLHTALTAPNDWGRWPSDLSLEHRVKSGNETQQKTDVNKCPLKGTWMTPMTYCGSCPMQVTPISRQSLVSVSHFRYTENKMLTLTRLYIWVLSG